MSVDERVEVRIRADLIRFRFIQPHHGADPEIWLHFHHRETHRAVTRDLEQHRAVKRNGAREHRGSRRHFAEQTLHGFWVRATFQNRLPGLLQTDRAATCIGLRKVEVLERVKHTLPCPFPL